MLPDDPPTWEGPTASIGKVATRRTPNPVCVLPLVTP
jgi:hypothetical protein